MKSALRRGLVAAAATGLMLGVTALGTAQPAFADSTEMNLINIVTDVDLRPAPAGVPDNPNVLPVANVPSDALLTNVETVAGGTGNPYGCYGQTDLPHHGWDSYGDYVSTHARTNCRLNVPHVRVDTAMYRARWYGAQHLASSYNFRDNWSNTSYDAVTRYYCGGTYTYQNVSAHEVKDGAQTYTARTTNSARILCN